MFDIKMRVCDLVIGDEFMIFNISYIVIKKSKEGIFYKLKSHKNDLKYYARLGAKSQQFAIVKRTDLN